MDAKYANVIVLDIRIDVFKVVRVE